MTKFQDLVSGLKQQREQREAADAQYANHLADIIQKLKNDVEAGGGQLKIVEPAKVRGAIVMSVVEMVFPEGSQEPMRVLEFRLQDIGEGQVLALNEHHVYLSDTDDILGTVYQWIQKGAGGSA